MLKAGAGKLKVYNVLSYTCIGLHLLLYSVPHWIFAMKYWIVAYKLGEGKMIRMAKFFYYFFLFSNIAISIFAAVE